MEHAFDIAAFRVMFPEFATNPNDPTLNAYWGMATGFMSSTDGVMLNGASLQLGLNLLTAHIAKMLGGAATGSVAPGPVTGGSEGTASASFAAPPTKSGWQFWLSTTPYGLQLWALLQVQSAGGLYVGGLPETGAFRKVGGVW